jgi:hypothetical protein
MQVHAGKGEQQAIEGLNMGGMHRLTREDIDVEAIRLRVRGMSDQELREYGRAAAWMADPVARRGQVLETYRVKLAEAPAEWCWRHPRQQALLRALLLEFPLQLLLPVRRQLRQFRFQFGDLLLEPGPVLLRRRFLACPLLHTPPPYAARSASATYWNRHDVPRRVL